MGIKYKGKNKKVKIKDMYGNDDEERTDPGWLCRCLTCGELGYTTIGVTPPDYCQQCWDDAHP